MPVSALPCGKESEGGVSDVSPCAEAHGARPKEQYSRNGNMGRKPIKIVVVADLVSIFPLLTVLVMDTDPHCDLMLS